MTKEEILEKVANINKDEAGNRIYYLWEVERAMEKYGNQRFNEGIQVAADNADADFTEIDRGEESLPLIEVYVIKNSILEHKIKE